MTLSNELDKFYGSEHLYSAGVIDNCKTVYTDGIKYIIDNTKDGRMLIQNILMVCSTMEDNFIYIKVNSTEEGKVKVEFQNGNCEVLERKLFFFQDFPQDKFSMYFKTDYYGGDPAIKTLLLPGEY